VNGAAAHELTEPLRPYLEVAAEDIFQEIRDLVPEYDRSPDSRYARRMRWTIAESVRQFVDAMETSAPDWDVLTGIYADIGRYEARAGRSLDGLQTAIRVSGQVACRRFIREAHRLGWSLQTLGTITESLFGYLERIVGAASQGWAEVNERMATERERHRERLRDLLVAEPPASRQAITELARSAGWEPPRTIAVVALRPPDGPHPPVLPPHLLADWHDPSPYAVVPDPDGLGPERLAAAFDGRAAAVGPTVALPRGGMSLRWARRARDLVDRGVITAGGVVHCRDHVPALIVFHGEDLLVTAARDRLAPLMALPAHRRLPLARTLLAYVENRDNAVAAAAHLMVHPQTVRYRIRRLEEILGDLVYAPEHRVELVLLMRLVVSGQGSAPESLSG